METDYLDCFNSSGEISLQPSCGENEHCDEEKGNLSLSINGIQCSEKLKELHSQQDKALERIRILYREIIGSCPITKKTSTIRNVSQSLLIADSNQFTKSNRSDILECESQSRALILNNSLVHTDRFLGDMENADSLYYQSCFQTDNVMCDVIKNENEEPYTYENYVPKNKIKASTNEKKLSHIHSNKASDKQYALPLNITVPEPFKMTLREIQEKDKRLLKRKQLTEKWQKPVKQELNIKIHANPVPAHVHLPLYQKMMENYEKRKIERKENSVERAKTIFKPFNFSLKQDGALRKSSSVPNLATKNSTEEKHFKAKPIPKDVLDGNISQKLKVEEEFRKIRIIQRAEKMLKESSSPFTKRNYTKSSSLTNLSDSNDETYKLSKVKSKKFLQSPVIKITTENSFSWEPRVTTVCQPFNLSTNHISKEKGNSADKMKQADGSYYIDSYCSLLGNKKKPSTSCSRTPISSVSPRSSSPEVPVKMTVSSLLREHQVRKELEEKENSLREEIRKKEEKAKREIELQKVFIPKFRANDPTLNKRYTVEDKVKNFRDASLMRELEYEQELKEIQERVLKKPLLVERQTLNAAKHLIERQFEEKLKDAGLDMDFVQMQSEKFVYSLTNSDLFNEDTEFDSHIRSSSSSFSSRTEGSAEGGSDNSKNSHGTHSSCEVSS